MKWKLICDARLLQKPFHVSLQLENVELTMRGWTEAI